MSRSYDQRFENPAFKAEFWRGYHNWPGNPPLAGMALLRAKWEDKAYAEGWETRRASETDEGDPDDYLQMIAERDD